MLAGILAARNIAGGEQNDVWAVNVEQDYHEESKGERQVPGPVRASPVEQLLRDAFARYDAIALGTAVAAVFGFGLFGAMATLLIKGGDPIGPNLALLGSFLIGFEASWGGALIGLLEGGLVGFAFGYLLARAINMLVGLYEASIRRRLQLARALDPLETSSNND